MKIRWIFLPFLIVVFQNQSVISAESQWTEKKLGSLSLKAAQAAKNRNWSEAILYSKQLLEGTKEIEKPNSTRYINFLKDFNRYHDKAGRLNEVASSVKDAYFLSKENLGITHPTTRMCRTLYYKLRISNKSYAAAIPLVLENISILKEGRNENYKHLQYLKQLYSLYGLSGQLQKEETTLKEFLSLSKSLYNRSDEDNISVITNLANNYCRQGKLDEFQHLIDQYNLKYFCE